MPIPRIGAAGVGLPLPANISGLFDNKVALGAGRTWLIPSGSWEVVPGEVTMVQFKDPVSGLWSMFSAWPNSRHFINSDGGNFRLANLTGCMIGALITNRGSGYTSAPTVTASAGSPTLLAILSPSISSVTITTAGSGYTYPPIVLVAPPPAGGIQATVIATISAGAVNAVTVIDEGAGYSGGIPVISVVTDPRDPATNIVPAVLTGVLTAAGTVRAVVVTDPGAPQTAVATLTFAGGGGASAAATAIYCFALTGFTNTIAGVAYGTSQPFLVQSVGGVVAGTATNVNPSIEKSILQVRQGHIAGTSTAGGATTATGAVVVDPGLFQAVPFLATIPAGDTLPTTLGQQTAAVGGITDVSWLQPR